MGWDQLLDQAHVKHVLQQAIARCRVAHAYLFHGPDGVGKRAAALVFAKALLCENEDAAPCGECGSCRKVAKLMHADLHFLLPYPTDVAVDEIVRRRGLIAENPYATVDFVRRPFLDDPSKSTNKQSLYTVGRVHEELIHALGFRPLEGRYKVAIVTDADMMRREGANAFLKRLEEPFDGTVLILTTRSPDRLLPTVSSRCQQVRFDRLPVEAIEGWLVERESVKPDRAALVARMSDGSLSRALDLARDEQLIASRDLVITFTRHAYSRDTEALVKEIDTMAGQGRERVKGFLRLVLDWTRDLVVYGASGDVSRLVNVDKHDVIQKFSANVPYADLSAMVAATESAIELIERNVNTRLVLLSLSSALRRSMRGEVRAAFSDAGVGGSLYRPLATVGPE